MRTPDARCRANKADSTCCSVSLAPSPVMLITTPLGQPHRHPDRRPLELRLQSATDSGHHQILDATHHSLGTRLLRAPIFESATVCDFALCFIANSRI